LEEHSAERFADGVVPVGGFVVEEHVLAGHRIPKKGDGCGLVSFGSGDAGGENVAGDVKDLPGVVLDGSMKN